MRIYISGISGTGMGPLALMAKDAGMEVCGSDLNEGAILPELKKAGIDVKIGKQDGEFLREKAKEGIDWFVYTSALPKDHPELKLAQDMGLHISKRDDFTEYLVETLGLKMVAIAGTHGKTTTTSMVVWTALKLGLPVSYVVGSTLSFAPSGSYEEGDEYFIYEADEYDRNFLKFHPWLAAITCIGYDHPDIYKKKRDYKSAFLQFKAQSEQVLEGEGNAKAAEMFDLAGNARREDARLAMGIIICMLRDQLMLGNYEAMVDFDEIIKILNEFPGVGRRFEKLADGIYTDYAHHPEEVKATIEIALEQAEIDSKKGVVAIYEPHQNTRQYEVRDGYKDAFVGVEKVFWLPTYLTREDSKLPVLSQEELASVLVNESIVEIAEPSVGLWKRIQEYIERGYLVLLMTAGPADEWLRKMLKK